MARTPTVADLLDYEAAHPASTGVKEELCVSELGVKMARDYQLLHRAVQTSGALEHDPKTTHRVLRRLA